MSEQQDHPSAKKRIRRCTKHDETPRPYKCGCGRGYYSYPALYTHLKIKHEGQPPAGTQIPSDKHYGSRGRPREKILSSKKKASIKSLSMKIRGKIIKRRESHNQLMKIEESKGLFLLLIIYIQYLLIKLFLQMNWKQVYAFSEHRTKRILSGNAKFKEHKSNIHSPRNSQHSHKDTMIGLQRISKEIVESLTKALTPNFKVRQNSPKPIPQEQEQKQILKSNKEPEIIRQPLEQMENVKQNKEIENVEYINFTKLARKISQQPIKEIKIQK